VAAQGADQLKGAAGFEGFIGAGFFCGDEVGFHASGCGAEAALDVGGHLAGAEFEIALAGE
jgi:hypothetical protein